MVSDVRLIWKNAETYNGKEHDVTVMGTTLSDVFEKKINDILSKSWSVIEDESIEDELSEEHQQTQQQPQQQQQQQHQQQQHHHLQEQQRITTPKTKPKQSGIPSSSSPLAPIASTNRSAQPEMTFEEKRQLCIMINNLDSKHLGRVVQIIHRALPDFLAQTESEEVEINIEQLDNSTLRELETYAKEVTKNKDKQ